MDPTQPTQTNNQPNVIPTPIIPQQPQKSSLNIILLVLVIILAVIVVVTSGYILLPANKKTTSPKITPQILPSESVKPTATITPTSIITDDPNDIDVGSVEADLKDIETDIQGLQ